jgi:Ca2+-binding EF-hand superfamily protein
MTERVLTLDVATEIVKKSRSDISQAVEDADLLGLSELLVEMFNEADSDKSGALTFDEFQKLMERIDLGISPQELRFVIQEADEDGNGVVDYNEFVPLAVDLIQAFKARNKGSIVYHAEDALLTQRVNDNMSVSELILTSTVCMEKITEMDSSGSHNWKYSELRRALVHVSPKSHMTETEINIICDSFCNSGVNSRISEKTFLKNLKKSRFVSIKNDYIKSESSPLLSYLFGEVIKIEEADKLDSKEKKSTGHIGVRQFQQVLHNLKSPILSRLQIIVIMSEANENHGNLDYYQFLPQVSKTIEMMCDPKALKQRAELIEQKVLNSENLVHINKDELKSQLLALFKSNDIDRSNNLCIDEFTRVLLSLDYQLSNDEIIALFQEADSKKNGEISFDNFYEFMDTNLEELEKKKHMKLLEKQSHAHNGKSSNSKSNSSSNSSSDQGIVTKTKPNTNYEASLKSVLRLEDTDSTGMIDHIVFEKLLRNLHLDISDFQVEIIMSELSMSSSGQIDYHEFIPVCVSLLRTFEAKGEADEQLHKLEQEAYDKSDRIVSCLFIFNFNIHYIIYF